MGKVSKELFGGTTSKTNPSTVYGAQEPYLADIYSQAQGLNKQGINPTVQNVYQNAATGNNQWLNSFQNPTNDPTFTNYANMIGQQYNEQIMPGIQSDAIAAGGLGNSRQGIAEGIAARGAGQALSNFGAQAYSGQQDRSLQAGTTMLNNQLIGAQQLQQMPWYNLNQYKGILGNPTVLGGGGSSSGTTGVVTGVGNFIGNMGGGAAIMGG